MNGSITIAYDTAGEAGIKIDIGKDMETGASRAIALARIIRDRN